MSNGEYKKMYLKSWKENYDSGQDGIDKNWKGSLDYGFKRMHFNVEEDIDAKGKQHEKHCILEVVDQKGRIISSLIVYDEILPLSIKNESSSDLKYLFPGTSQSEFVVYLKIPFTAKVEESEEQKKEDTENQNEKPALPVPFINPAEAQKKEPEPVKGEKVLMIVCRASRVFEPNSLSNSLSDNFEHAIDVTKFDVQNMEKNRKPPILF